MNITPPDPVRSRNMAAVRGKDTKPELAIRQRLHASGLRYRVNMSLQLGGVRIRPDIVFTRQKIAVFVDGCFWHMCPVHKTSPATNSEFWQTKLLRNVERDRIQDEALRQNGWHVIRFWEHDDPEAAATAVREAVRQDAR